LEAIKPGYEQPIDGKTYRETIEIFESLLKVLHPFMPFISEEIWHIIGERKENESLVIERWPTVGEIDQALIQEFYEASELVKELRTLRKEKNIPFKEALTLIVNGEGKRTFDPVVSKLANLESVLFSNEKPEKSQAMVIGSVEYYIPMNREVDAVEESKKLASELEYTKGFLSSIMRKLDNEKFVNNAPESVVAIEHKKRSEAEERIAALEKQIESLTN